MVPSPADIAATRIEAVRQAAESLRRVAPFRPRVLVVLGSGLDDVVDALEVESSISFEEVPGMPAAGVVGHAGRFVFGRSGDLPVLVMQGRVHLYEGHAPDVVVLPVRAARQLGCETLIVTNAAGGLGSQVKTGDLMLLTDHMNLMGANPLVGSNLDEFGTRFPPMATAYTPKLQELARQTARDLGIPLSEGVYAGVLGPSFETPAEAQAIASAGATVVGMSTVLEVIAAVHAGMDVLGLSLVTNMSASVGHGHEDVLAASAAATPLLGRLVAGILSRL